MDSPGCQNMVAMEEEENHEDHDGNKVREFKPLIAQIPVPRSANITSGCGTSLYLIGPHDAKVSQA